MLVSAVNGTPSAVIAMMTSGASRLLVGLSGALKTEITGCCRRTGRQAKSFESVSSICRTVRASLETEFPGIWFDSPLCSKR